MAARTSAANPTVDQPRLDGTLRAVVRAFGLLRRVMDPYFARFGISSSQWGVLRALHRAEGEGVGALRLTDLCDRLLVRPPSVTGVVDRLQRIGLIARAKSAEDQRVKMVRLTAAGREKITRVLEQLPAQHDLVLGDLNMTERDELRRLLEVLSQRLQTLAANGDHEIEEAE
jgi:DNA-binding MarR family transcriptional regulator